MCEKTEVYLLPPEVPPPTPPPTPRMCRVCTALLLCCTSVRLYTALGRREGSVKTAYSVPTYECYDWAHTHTYTQAP